MKTLNEYLNEDFFKNVGSTPEDNKKRKIEVWMKEYNIKNYTINKDFTIDSGDRVRIIDFEGSELPEYINFNHCAKNFYIEGKNLTTLRCCPKKVDIDFSCAHCINLTSLEGGPEEVGRDYNCIGCINLETLKGHPKSIGGVFYYCSYEALKENPKIELKGCLKHPKIGIRIV